MLIRHSEAEALKVFGNDRVEIDGHRHVGKRCIDQGGGYALAPAFMSHAEVAYEGDLANHFNVRRTDDLALIKRNPEMIPGLMRRNEIAPFQKAAHCLEIRRCCLPVFQHGDVYTHSQRIE